MVEVTLPSSLQNLQTLLPAEQARNEIIDNGNVDLTRLYRLISVVRLGP